MRSLWNVVEMGFRWNLPNNSSVLSTVLDFGADVTFRFRQVFHETERQSLMGKVCRIYEISFLFTKNNFWLIPVETSCSMCHRTILIFADMNEAKLFLIYRGELYFRLENTPYDLCRVTTFKAHTQSQNIPLKTARCQSNFCFLRFWNQYYSPEWGIECDRNI